MTRMHSAGRLLLGGISIAASIGLVLISSPPTAKAAPPPQLSPEDAALVKLNAGRRAFNEKNYPVALNSFREFLTAAPGHGQAPGAWFGVGLCLLQGAQPDYVAAGDAFKHAATTGAFPDRALALYYWGVALRELGSRSSADARARPGEAETHRKAAATRYAEAAVQFSAAQAAFAQRVTAPAPAAPAELPIDLEWSARARCDATEMMLRLGKYKEALDASRPFQTDAVLSRSRYMQLGLYQLGYAQFAMTDYLSAGRTLSQLAPFAQDFGLHARYLLGRVHHLSDERPEAAAQYKIVQDEFEVRKKAAEQALTAHPLEPLRKAQLESLAHGPMPEYVSRARFYGAVLQYEDGRYAEAGQVFTTILQQQPNDPIAPEARLRLGFCWLQLKKFNEAAQALDALKEDRQFSDRAIWWLARVRVGSADPANAQAYGQAITAAVDMLGKAADRAQQMAATDPDAKSRRLDILIELADTQQIAKQFKEAAASYQKVLTENPKSDRAEEAMQRRVTALHLAGLFKESDAAAEQFFQAYPKSTLMPAVLFRMAENAYLTALAAADDKTASAGSRQAALPRAEQQKLFQIAIARYEKLIGKYPEFDYSDLARQATATCHARLGQYTEAIAILLTIPESSRSGELAMVPYLLADCDIRTLPPEAEDALTAERLIETAEDAAKLLESFVAAQPKSPQAPDALLKLGYCYQRIASQLAVPQERQKILAKAKDAYDRSVQQFPNDPSQPSVIFERARCLALIGDAGGAQNELRKFQADPLRKTPNAPLAMVRLSALLRAMNQPQQAVDVMKRCREESEAALAADVARADWVPLLQYEHALALLDLRKLPEARTILEEIVRQFPGKPEAINSSWRIAQCRRQEAADKLTEARNVAARPGVDPAEVNAAYAKAEQPLKLLAAAAQALQAQADASPPAAAGSEATLRMLYELAWCYRVAGDDETDAARLKLQRDALEKVRARWPKDQPKLAAGISTPEIALSDVPVQPGEKKAQELYQRLIAAAPASALASQARFELAELLCQRDQVDAALDLLATALENQPPKALAQRIKVRVAAALLAKNNPAPALAQLKPILADKDSPVGPEALYLSGEAQIQQRDWAKAIEALLPFRDQDPYRNIPGITDHALMRLGHALEQSSQWDPARQTFEAVVGRFPQSEWVDHARFEVGWCFQSQKRYDQAVNAYADLIRRAVSEPAARAQLNIGVCRLEQKQPAEALKTLLLVPLSYDYPELGAAACYHAAQALLDSQKPQEAMLLLQRVLKDYPRSQWASLAHKKLVEMR